MTTQEKVKALAMVANAIVEAVKAAGAAGAPGGVLYAGLSSYGINSDQYQQFMGALVGAGKLRREGELYFNV